MQEGIIMSNHKLLVIGAGIGQIPIIEKAKQRGIHVTVVTLPGVQPGIKIADDVFYCDIYDRDRIVDWAKAHGITAVTSDQNDLMNPTVAYVAEKMGLPGNSFSQVMSYCNKNIYRENCDRIGNPVPQHVAVTDSSFDPRSFNCPLPWIVKPADSQSSVGVQKLDSIEELKPALEAALSKSKTHGAILEEFFTGKEIVCEGFIENGEYHLLAFADRKYFKLKDLMIPSQTIFPSTIKRQLLDQVLECERRMASYINPSFAIVHSEYLINEESNTICVVESALRGGGVYISSDLIPAATGIDINDVLLDKALGESVDVKSIFESKQNKASAYICFYLPEGIVESISGVDKIQAMPFVIKVCLDNIHIGEQTEPMLHKGSRKGPILISGKNRNELENNISIIQNTLQIETRCSSGELRGIIWG